MRSQVYLTLLSALRPFLITSFALALPAITACGGDDDTASAPIGPKKDAGDDDDFDATFAPPVAFDAGKVVPGDPPAELVEEACAVDTNKLYDLIKFDRLPEPTRLAVDVVNSRFALAYIDKSEACIDAVYVAQIDGERVNTDPQISLALDPCTSIDHAAIEYDGKHWLLGTIDARGDARDIWVQEIEPDSKAKFTAYNVTESDEAEREFALLALSDGGGVLVAWVEDDASNPGSMRLKTRKLSASGKPGAEAIALEQPKDMLWTITDLSVVQLGTTYVGLAYRRATNTGVAELVLDVLSRDGARDRDPWVLSTEAGGSGSIDLGADGDGAAVIYSLVQGTSEQLWFQLLDLDGRAAPVRSGGRVGGAAEPMRVVGPPFKANGASLAKLPNGFAVAYRALVGGSVSSPRIRVHFLDSYGRIIGKSDAALAKEHGGRTAIKGAYDGRVVLGWSDQTDEGKTTVTAARLPCIGGL